MDSDLLDKHFHAVDDFILSRQDPVTGLLPASTATNAHGDYTDAWIRDNVYSILAAWGLALVYRRLAPDHERHYLLSQSVVKLMRGLLNAMMRQSDRVETFKKSLDPADAVHAKFGTRTGLAVVGDEEWGHLQLDAISLYLLILAQMIASGLRIVYSIDEVNFIQNLVHYISRTYCTPDYGIWERGNKSNHGITEINCSSVGMAKAALEALSGFNLFGNVRSAGGIIHVVPSDPARSRFTLSGLLPRESNSKETDAALLSIIGYPAYAIESRELVERTRNKIVDSLSGKYGCKRFLLDGHQSALEDGSRLHYEPSELQKFRHIESEWPLFFCYLLLEALMRGDQQDAEKWRQKLEPLFVQQDSRRMLPELFYVPAERIQAERENPGSQQRVANENLPLTWAQSLFMLADMIQDGLLRAGDIDPLSRRDRIGFERKTPVLIPVIAENPSVKQQLQDLGFNSETVDEVEAVKVQHASDLSEVHSFVGKNDKLGLSGRPMNASRTLTTSKLYQLAGQSIIYLPYYFNPSEFYLSHDNQLLVEHYKTSIGFISACWDQPGQPLLTLLVRSDMLDGKSRDHLLGLLSEIQRGQCNGIEVNTDRLAKLATTASIERIEYLHDYQFVEHDLNRSQRVELPSRQMSSQTRISNAVELQKMKDASDDTLIDCLNGQAGPVELSEILRIMSHRHGLGYSIPFKGGSLTLGDLCENYYESACSSHHWSLTRRMADLLSKTDSRVEDTLLDIIIRQKRLSVGRAYSDEATFSRPQSSDGIISVIRKFAGKTPAESALSQEILLHLGLLLKSEAWLFKNILTLRVWHFIQLLVAKTGREQQLQFGQAYEHLLTLAPSRILSMLREILESLNEQEDELLEQELLTASGLPEVIPAHQGYGDIAETKADDWDAWRRKKGGLINLSSSFYKDIWHLLSRCNAIVIGDKYDLGNRIDSQITHDSTPGERSFALLIEGEFNNIGSPAYRQLNIELMETLVAVMNDNPHLNVEGDLTFDIIIGYAVRIAWQADHKGIYDEQREQAWNAFYQLPPAATRQAFVDAIWHLLSVDQSRVVSG